MEKIKILTVSDMAVATGFARVMESITKHFPDSWEIHSLAINYMGDPYECRNRLYPAMLGGDPYGFGRLGNLVNSIDPTYIFILQDSWILQRYLEILGDHLDKIVTYVPVDAGPYMPEWLVDFPKVKQVVAYTEYGKEVLQDSNPEITNITVIPHGIDTEVFKPLDSLETRKMFKSIKPEHFVILNVN